MISRNIHEYISYITCIPKCERCYYAGPRVFFVHKAKNGDRRPVLGKANLPEREREKERECVCTRTKKKMCHVMRREASRRGWPEPGEPTREKEGKEGRGRCKNPEKEAAAPSCTQLSPFSLVLALSPSRFLFWNLKFWFYALYLLPPSEGSDMRYEISWCVPKAFFPRLLRCIPCPHYCVKSITLNNVNLYVNYTFF